MTSGPPRGTLPGVAHLHDAKVPREHELLVRASRLYYELGETQEQVAERLGVTRAHVSKLLKRARAATR